MGHWWGEEAVVTYKGIWSAPDFFLLGKLDLMGSLQFSFFPAIFALLFTDMFDSLSTFTGVAQAGNMLDADGQPRDIKKSLVVDALSTMVSALAGTSSGTSYIESAAGIQAGGRSGVVAIVAGLLFIPFMFLSPLLSMVPTVATAPILVLVGVFMMAPVAKVQWSKMEQGIPAFLTLILIPMSYSITHGIIWGFLSYTVLPVAVGKARALPPALIVIDMCAVFALVL